jgi:hypothetical protein
MRFALPVLVALAGCSTPRITVVPSGSGVSAPAKAADCSLSFLRTPPRDRPYDELASLHYTTTLYWEGDPVAAQDAMRERACRLGADAVLVVQEFVPGVGGQHGKPPTMAGLAIRFRTEAAATPGVGAATL